MKNKFFAVVVAVSTTLISVSSQAQKTGTISETRISSSGNDESFINMTEDGHSYKIRLKGNTVI